MNEKDRKLKEDIQKLQTKMAMIKVIDMEILAPPIRLESRRNQKVTWNQIADVCGWDPREKRGAH